VSVVANVAINVDSRNAVSKLRQVESQAKITERAFNGLSSALAAFGAGFAISRVIQDVKELDTNLRRLGTVGGDVSALDKGLGQLSKNLDGVANKAELAAASYQALSAGFTETGANLKVVEAATKAAVGGLVDVAGATEVTTKVLNAYGLSGQYAINVTDSISKAIEYGVVTWGDYSSQLGRVASVAALAGVSLDEVNAFIASATKNSATAEVAFTGLSATLATMVKPSKESADAAEALGINWNLAGIRGEGFESLIGKLAKAMQENPVLAAEMVGGQEAIRGAFAAAGKGGSDYQMILEGLGGATGKTEADFQKMKGSLENTLKALDTSFANLSEAMFKAFGPTVVIVIQDLTKAVNSFAGIISEVPQPVMNTAGAIAKAVVQVLLLQKALQGILALRAALLGMFAATAVGATTAGTAASGLSMNMRYLQGSMAAAQTQGSALAGILRSIAAFGIITVGINLVVTGLQEAMAAAAETRRLRGERAAGGAAAIYGGSATTEQKAAAQKTLAAVRKEQQQYKQPGTIAAQTLLGPASQLFGVPTTAQAGARRTVLMERAARAQGVLGLPTRAEQAAGLPTPTPTPVPTGAGEEDKAGKKAKDKAAEEEARMQSRLRGLIVETNAIQKQQQIREKITQAEIAGDQQLAARLQGEERTQQILASVQGDLVGITDERERQAVLAKAAAEIDAVQSQTAGELNKLEADRSKAIEDVVGSLDMELLRIQTNTDAQKQALQFLEIENQLKAQGITLTDGDAEAIRRKIAEMQKLTKEQQAANDRAKFMEQQFAAIGSALGDQLMGVFDNLINKTEDWNDVLRNALMSVGRVLMMAGLNMLAGTDGQGVLSFLGFGSGFGKRAMGGPVSGNQPYIVGERGPELFVPGVSGSVVSNADTRAALAQQTTNRQGNDTRAMLEQQTTNRQMNSGGNAMQQKPIEVKYESTVINGVEYVTAEQHQRGITLAAERGRALTLQTLQNSVKTRKRVGMA
jgi:TP901 family phage tail tape measure protein